ncbi:CaiB/BaiF CoA transferase family protein [Mycolicibacterium holsaticum]|uniref:CaiB/BaiF CoA transferase family protein n=1 Tax=Mycolicibacterium holsaticum TaxID=152142 RepID=UPI001C7CFB1F|nr:CoA transferase [Mycolicibacterium holsaticum]QZA12539.1 CoA transferase [Mycolicibacterium holsaticum DSM 44478 = JCM 12374]UNC09981.1 CoA transferase [Mycolicibacterium holsaticum DSM 44478 = JCM 12374]
MPGVLDGVRVVELATWGFIPSAGVALADWGAEVIKVEHPAHGDPMRGLVSAALTAQGEQPVSFMFQTFSRNKASVGIDLRTDGGRDALYRLVGTADVFLTNYLAPVRRKLRVDVDDLTAVNPRLIYARGTGLGPKGEEADTGGFDLASYWSRGGVAYVSTPEGADYPPPMPGAAFGDLQSGLYAAGGVAAALFARERTGEPQVVDVSLLGSAVWGTAPHIAASSLFDIDAMPRGNHQAAHNPLSNTYRTSDGRFVALVMLESDRFWAPLVELIGRPDLASDERYVNAAARRANSKACIAELDAIFAARTAAEWREVLSRQRGVWAIVQTPDETRRDGQVVANEYVTRMELDDGAAVTVARPPVQFNGAQADAHPAPELGADTDHVLLELGYTWDDVVRLKVDGAIT